MLSTPAELGVVTDAMLDAITAELEKIRGEKAPEGRWNPRAKRRSLRHPPRSGRWPTRRTGRKVVFPLET